MNPDRFVGAFIGLAVGDALGAAVEFKPHGTFKPITDMVDGGPHNIPAGYWTDDTSMAIALAESLIEKGFDPADQMERYWNWYQNGLYSSTGECFDIGNTVREALDYFKQTGEPFAGSPSPYSAGNGSLMRLAPVPLYYIRENDETLGLCAIESSRTTHAAPTCLDACRYYAILIKGAVRGAAKEALLSPYFSNDEGYWEKNPLLTSEINAVVEGSFKADGWPQIRGTGFVVKSMEAALWAFYHSQTFEEGALKAANLGDDADTTAAIYGQLAGAFYGLEAIPADWRLLLAKQGLLLDVAHRLYQCAFPEAE